MRKTSKKQARKKFVWAISQAIKYFLIMCGLASCGSTKVAVSKPAEGTSTTITVTTNNPIQTNVTPNIELNQK